MKDSNESATLADTLSGFTVRRMMPPAVLLAAFLLVGVGIWGPEARAQSATESTTGAIGAANTPDGAGVKGAGEKTVTLNFREMEIQTLISTVSDITGRNFIVDPRVRGKVTVISKHAMGEEELYRVFLSILQVHGFSAVQTGEVTKIIPDITAKQSGVPVQSPFDGAAQDEYVTQVIPIENVAAAQLVPILRPLVPQQSHLAAYPPTNVLIISDRSGNIDRMLDIVRRIDKANTEEIEVIRIDHASATDLARVLQTLYKRDPNQPSSTNLQISVDERTNSLLVVGDPTGRLRVRALIAQLDVPVDTGGGSTQVVYLRYANAKDLLPVLTGIGDHYRESSAQRRAPVPAQNAVAGGDSNSLSGLSEADLRINIQADENSNALVITASPKVFKSMRSVISQLDIRRSQVMVEAIIAEVSSDKASELGVNWLVDGASGQSSQEGGAALSNFGGTLGTLVSLAGGTSAALPGGFTMAVGDFRSGGTRFAAVLNALTSNADTNILSTPTLMTTDNEAAEIRVAENVPFVTGQYTNTGSDSSVSPFQTIEREDVGLILKVKPQINEGDSIKLDIELEVSNLSTSVANAVDITTKKRTVKTSVIVENRQVLVIGGLIDDSVSDTEQKVPFLGDIPVLGAAFRYTKTSKVKRNLMIFLHPVVMRDASEALYHTSQKYDYIRTLQLEKKQKGTLLLRKDRYMPLLPEFTSLVSLPPPFEELEDVAPAGEVTSDASQPVSVPVAK